MSDWTEEDSATFREIASVAVPRRSEMVQTLVDAVPFGRSDRFKIVEIGAGEGMLADALLAAFPAAMCVALDGSESMRAAIAERTKRFADRIRIRDFNLVSLDWWDVMFGADLVVSSLCLHHLSDPKKQYLYKAAADRMSPGGVFLVADLVEPSHEAARRLAADAWDRSVESAAAAQGRPELFTRFVGARWNHYRFPDSGDHPAALLHHLVWLKHAGFTAVECFWLFAGHAVFGGFRPAAASAAPPLAGN